MIDLALEFVRDQLNDFLITQIPMGDTDRVTISNVVQQEQGTSNGVSDLQDDRILCSLIHIEEDRILKEQGIAKGYGTGVVGYREPDLRINVYVLFSSHFTQYLTGIRNLSGVISFFQAYRVFDATDYPGLDPRIQRLVMDLYTTSLDQNFQFWQSLGGKFLPSVMYKMRLLIFQQDMLQGYGTSVIETGLDSGHIH